MTDNSAGERYKATIPDTLDLAERARWGLNHFTTSVSEKDNYEMYWGSSPWGVPAEVMSFIGLPDQPKLGASFGEYDPPYMIMHWSPLHACQPKAMEAMAMERIMSGSDQLLDREARMAETLGSYVGDDGIYWVPPDPNKPWFGPVELRPQANVHGQGRIMRAMIIWYQTTGDPVWKQRIDRMVDGLDRIVFHKDDYAYFPIYGWIPHEYFRACYTDRGWKDTREPVNEKDGEEGSLFNHQGHIPGALSNWYTLTGNEKALRLAGELVRFYTQPQFWADWEQGDYPGVVGAEHAHWNGHFHGYINTLRAILEYAIATNDSRLKAFVRDGYEWTRHSQMARIGLVGDGQGCGCGRLIGLAVKLSDAGIGDYWEDVDQYIRNHGIEMQFTPDDIPFLEQLGEGKPPPPEHPGMSTENVIQATVGAFSGSVKPFKTMSALCCSTHGNMGLFYAWEGTLRYTEPTARVNLLLNRASPWMDIDSYLPYEGKVVLRNKQAREAFVRIPLWVDRGAIRCTLAGNELPQVWFRQYLRFGDLRPGDALTIEFPVVERIERWTAPQIITRDSETSEHDFRFRGNTLVEVTPPLLAGSPLYRGRPERYGATEAPMKQATRFAAPLVLKW